MAICLEHLKENNESGCSMKSNLILIFIFLILPILSSAEQKDMHVFLLIGQSNMAGRAKLKPGDDKLLKDCQLWNGKSWEDAKAPFNRYSTHRKKNFTQGMNPGPEFVKAYQKANSGVRVGIINWARGGSKIEQWATNQNLYKDALKNTKESLKIKNSKLVGVLWHQGESNSKNVEAYPKQLAELIKNLRKDFSNDKLLVVFGQIGGWNKSYDKFNEMIVKQPAKISGTACISNEGLGKMDAFHFNHEAQLEMGKRYAAAMLKLLKK